MAPDGRAGLRRVGIVGLGVMGGSLARALGALTAPPVRVGWSPKARETAAALAAGALDQGAGSLAEVARDADLVVLAAPLRATCEMIPDLVRHLSADGVLTDVAGLKVPVAHAVAAAGSTGRWVGSHPMCGSAESGFEASRGDLFVGARVYLVSDPSASGPLERISTLWTELGARPTPITGPEHDARMTLVSHVPQLTANALAALLRDAGVDPDDLGPGGRDMTRLAASSPEVWRDVLAFSGAADDHLRDLARELTRLARSLSAGDLDAVTEMMTRSRAWRRRS